MNKLQEIKEKIIEANPSIGTRNISVKIPEPFSGIINYRDDTIRLADCVLAVIKKMDEKNKSEVAEVMLQFAYLWNCFNDSLDSQSKETLSFLWELLCKEG